MQTWFALYGKFILSFFFIRLATILFFCSSFAVLTFTGWLNYIWLSFMFDSCVTALLLFPLFLFNALWLKRPLIFKRIIACILFLLILVSVIDVFHIAHYGVRLNLFSFAQTNATVLRTVFWGWELYVAISLSVFLFLLIRHLLFKNITLQKLGLKKYILLIVFFFLASFLYYSNPLYRLCYLSSNTVVNESSKNAAYALTSSVYASFINAEKVPDAPATTESEALQEVARITKGTLTKGRVVRDLPGGTRKFKHIVLIVMESLGANNFNEKYAPNLFRLKDEGIYFTKCKAAGPRTQMAISSLVTGIPNILCNNFYRLKGGFKIETLGDLFSEAGYRTTYMHNGYLQYDDMDKFLKEGGFEELIDAQEMKTAKMQNEWGVEDEALFEKALQNMKGHAAEKTFHVLQTVTNHEPYEIPADFAAANPQLGIFDNRKLKTYYYADAMVGNFLEKLKKEPCYDSALVIITGDHGEANGPEEFQYKVFHVPLILLNAGKDVRNENCSHIDIPFTLANIIGPKAKTIMLGKDLLSDKAQYPVLSGNYDNELNLKEGDVLYRYYLLQGAEKTFKCDSHENIISEITLRQDSLEKLRKTTLAYYKLVREYILKGNLKRP